MKIGNPADKPPVNPVSTGRTASGDASVKKGGGADGEASAQVELSNTAAAMLSGSNAEFDADKVARISQAISDGTFKVNPEAIADKLIANAQELLKGSH